ncbi:Uma2 family endonuclease [Pseudonocardia phyllosphaerae]|uniref:Uma2 family endonuclease n=1 Tax=Pseudonocardia phyllosphaerae TaxID=3390502 RepID=UPI00397DB7C4
MNTVTGEQPATSALAAVLGALDDHPQPWTEQEFLSAPATRRVELVDGSLVVHPDPGARHERLSARLTAVLEAAAAAAGPHARLHALEAPRVRLAPGRVLVPDVVVLAHPDPDTVAHPARSVRLVVEVTGPGRAQVTRGLAQELWAAAGVSRYLRIELDGDAPTASLFALEDGSWNRIERVPPGGTTCLAEPVEADLDLGVLAAD